VKDDAATTDSIHPELTSLSSPLVATLGSDSHASSSQAAARELRNRAAVKESTARPPGGRIHCANDHLPAPARVVSLSADVRLPQSDLGPSSIPRTIAEGYQPLAEGYQPLAADDWYQHDSDGSEESHHGDDWHQNYYAAADQYKELIAEVRGMAQSSVNDQSNFMEYFGNDSLAGSGKIYHCYCHEGGADTRSSSLKFEAWLNLQ